MIKYELSLFFLKKFVLKVLIFEESSNWVSKLARLSN
jgi:hypothetical protein